MFYAYIHCKPDGTPFYVGKGNNVRVKKIDRPGNPHHNNIIKKYGRKNILVGKMECSTENIAFELERGLLKRLRLMGQKLVNLTEGGEGVSGLKMSDSAKQKMRNAKLGRRLSAEHKENLRIANTGKRLSPESREKVRRARIGIRFSEEHRENLRAAKAGKPLPRSTADKIRESLLGKWVWITNGVGSKMIKRDSTVPDGWKIGRTGRGGS